jgi:hypothetical protein
MAVLAEPLTPEIVAGGAILLLGVTIGTRSRK